MQNQVWGIIIGDQNYLVNVPIFTYLQFKIFDDFFLLNFKIKKIPIPFQMYALHILWEIYLNHKPC